jgi:hypothetical protein
MWWRPPCLLRRVILNLVSDRDAAYSGVLWSSRGAWLTFRDVAALRQGAEPAKLDGDLVVHRSNVEFLQVLP